MPRQCGCSGGPCRPPDPVELSRRDFLKSLGVGALALWGGSIATHGAHAAPVGPGVLPAGGAYGAYALTPPRVYSGVNLGSVAMPIGGIGTGSIWLDGQSRLRVWQIFNNHTETRVPCSFFAIRARQAGSEPRARVLQTEPEPGFAPVKSLTYEGGYPVAHLEYESDLPVSVALDAFNPFIPTDTANSSLPCAVFRFTVRNTTDRPVEATLLGSLQNAVGYRGEGEIDGVRHPEFGRNTTRTVREGGLTAVMMDSPAEPPAPGFVRVRAADGSVPATPLLFLDRLDDPAATVGRGSAAVTRLSAMSQLAAQPAVIVASETGAGFFASLRDAGDALNGGADVEIFEDFEDVEAYDGWVSVGQSFGRKPATGTFGNQQAVTGYAGRGFVNSYIAGDGPVGTLTSKTFTITKKYIGFLVGGGNRPGEACINLEIDGKVVRTATGRDVEELRPCTWDVSEFLGKEACFRIYDNATGGWGHINVDHIILSDTDAGDHLRLVAPFASIVAAAGLSFGAVEEVQLGATVASAVATDAMRMVPEEPWALQSHLRITDVRSAHGEIRVLATTYGGDPLLLDVPFGESRLVLSLAPGMPWAWTRAALLSMVDVDPAGAAVETTQTGWGSMALLTPTADAKAVAAWTEPERFGSRFEKLGEISGPAEAGPTPVGETVNGAMTVSVSLAPGEERVIPFVLAWHFPNAERHGHQGNHYCEVFRDALDAGRYVAENLEGLTDRTFLYRRTVYESNLPEEFLDAATSQSLIIRSQVCWRSASGYFAGYEGAYRCCPLNCTHVWNYAQTHGRLFPEIGRNMRVSDFVTYLHEDGETSHRQHEPSGGFADGHCACIEAALREHQMSPDGAFLDEVYDGVRKAMEWFIRRWDGKEEGVTRGHQWNTYDTAVSGLNTFIGSQYLSALGAAEKLAEIKGDGRSARRWRDIRLRGQKAQDEQLWNGEYYYQIPEPEFARDYNNGCHSDQLLGQWWAHQIGLGHQYPRERVRKACESIYKHNLKRDFTGLIQAPRRYVDDGDGGLYMCTWPGNDQPESFTLYSEEVWTGIEYSTAGLMVHEGLIDEARDIVKTARARYDGRPRKDINSGGGVCGSANPFEELECGRFYARAQSSWGLVIACQGFVMDGPEGLIGFRPNWRPEDHRSFFSAPEGWGLFVQTRANGAQTERLELRHGKLRVRELVFQVPDGAALETCSVLVGDRGVACKAEVGPEGDVRLKLANELNLREGQALDVTLKLK